MKADETSNFEDFETISCAVCSSDKFSVLFKNHDRLYGTKGVFNIVKCDECGLVYLNPRPRKEFIHNYYPNEYEPYNIDAKDFYQKLNESLLNSYYKENGSLIDWFKGLLCKYIYNPPPKTYKGRILDIGCGSGVYLHTLKKHGWDVYGVEMSSKAVELAREKLKLPNINLGLVEDIKYPEKFFDVVMMNHVIEHLFDPRHSLQEANRILKTGGLLIITTPNIDSVNFKIFGKYWFPLETPRHLNLFEVSTMSKLLRDAGFKLVNRSYDVSANQLVRSIGYVSSSLSSIANAISFVFIPFAVLAGILNKSDIVTFRGEK